MSSEPDSPSPQPPPRAFTQGVGTVFQFAGVTIFLVFFFVCCFSGLLSRDTAAHTWLADVGWGNYSAQRAVSICVVIAVVLGLSLASIGLGLQAQHRRSPGLAIATCGFATLFWLFQLTFFIFGVRSIIFSLLALILAAVFGLLLGLAINAWKEMKHNPPPADMEILPADYKIPYSHLHQDPPEVRLAAELQMRRQKLAVQQKELEMLEQKLHRQKNPPKT